MSPCNWDDRWIWRLTFFSPLSSLLAQVSYMYWLVRSSSEEKKLQKSNWRKCKDNLQEHPYASGAMLEGTEKVRTRLGRRASTRDIWGEHLFCFSLFLSVKMKTLSQRCTGSKSSVRAKILLALNSLCNGAVPLAPGAHGFAMCAGKA